MAENGNAGKKIIEVSKVSPWSDSTNPVSSLSHPLTPFDLKFSRFLPIERVLFYKLADSDPEFFESVVVPNLKLSFSLALRHFLPVAGKLVWPEDSIEPFILYTPNDSVSFTVAESTGSDDFNHLSGNHACEIKELKSLIPIIESSDSEVPLFAIQVTKFPNNGFSVGIAFHHVVFDGKTISMLLKTWAHFCKFVQNSIESDSYLPDLLPELTPSFERTNPILQIPIDFIPKHKTLKFLSILSTPTNWVRRTFELTRSQIEKLKKTVLESMEKKEKSDFHLSTFVVVYAYSLICLAKSKPEANDSTLFYIVLSADARRLLDPPISSNFFGCIVNHTGVAAFGREFTDENGFSKIAKKISDLVLELKESRVREAPKTYDVEADGVSSTIEACSVAASPKFKLYETDFGWGKPKKIEVVSLGKNNILLADARDGGDGVEVGLVLPNHQMDTFASLFLDDLN